MNSHRTCKHFWHVINYVVNVRKWMMCNVHVWPTRHSWWNIHQLCVARLHLQCEMLQRCNPAQIKSENNHVFLVCQVCTKCTPGARKKPYHLALNRQMGNMSRQVVKQVKNMRFLHEKVRKTAQKWSNLMIFDPFVRPRVGKSREKVHFWPPNSGNRFFGPTESKIVSRVPTGEWKSTFLTQKQLILGVQKGENWGQIH